MVVQCSGLTSKRLLKCDRVILSGCFDPLAVKTPLPCKSSNIAIYILSGTRHRCHLPSPWSPIGRWQGSLWEPSPRENLPQFSIKFKFDRMGALSLVASLPWPLLSLQLLLTWASNLWLFTSSLLIYEVFTLLGKPSFKKSGIL